MPPSTYIYKWHVGRMATTAAPRIAAPPPPPLFSATWGIYGGGVPSSTYIYGCHVVILIKPKKLEKIQ